MNTSARFILSGSIAIALALFTVLSAAFAGLAAISTTIGVSLLVAHGMIQIAILSYSTPRTVFSGPRHHHTGEVVAFPAGATQRMAA